MKKVSDICLNKIKEFRRWVYAGGKSAQIFTEEEIFTE